MRQRQHMVTAPYSVEGGRKCPVAHPTRVVYTRSTTTKQTGSAHVRHERHDQPEDGDQKAEQAAARKQPRRAPIRPISISGWRRSRRWASSSASPPRSIPISKPRPSPIWSALEKSPALLFENIKGHPGHKALYNMIGCNLSRFCLMIGEAPVDHPLKAVQALQKKLGRKMPPKEVPAATARSATRTSSRATRSTSACSRRSGCGRSTAASISAPATRW